jgi:hypothetical protein
LSCGAQKLRAEKNSGERNIITLRRFDSVVAKPKIEIIFFNGLEGMKLDARAAHVYKGPAESRL